MSRRVEICASAELAPGSVRRFEVEGQAVAVYNIDGRFYATSDRCTHGNASLSEGLLEGETIECDLHFGGFHVPTGKPVAPPCFEPLQTYPVVVLDGVVHLEMDG